VGALQERKVHILRNPQTFLGPMPKGNSIAAPKALKTIGLVDRYQYRISIGPIFAKEDSISTIFEPLRVHFKPVLRQPIETTALSGAAWRVFA
jgi:hypothetical protein